MSTPRESVRTRLADLEYIDHKLRAAELRAVAERGLSAVVVLGAAVRKAVRPSLPIQNEALRRRMEQEEQWERAFEPWYERMFAESIRRLPEAYAAAERPRIQKRWSIRKAKYLPEDANPATVSSLLDEYRGAPKNQKPRIEAQIRTLTGMSPSDARMALMNTLQTYTTPDKHAIMEALLADQAAAEALGAEMFILDGVQLYLQMAAQTGKVAGQTALEYMGLHQTFEWAHPQNMPRALYGVRGSKVIQGIYGEHLRKLSDIIAQATDPRFPMTISEVEARIKAEWPKLKARQIATIARTETAAVWTATSMNTYAANGIDSWESTIAHGPSIEIGQNAPCDVCVAQAAAGHFSINSGDIPPWHPSCRCEAIPVLEDKYGDPWLPPDEPWAGGGATPEGFVPTPAPPPGEPFGGLSFAQAGEGVRQGMKQEMRSEWLLGNTEDAIRALDAPTAWVAGASNGSPLMVAGGRVTDDIIHISRLASRNGGTRHIVSRIARDARASGRDVVINARGVSPQLRETLDQWGFKYDEARGTYTLRHREIPKEWEDAIVDAPGTGEDMLSRRIRELEHRYATVTDPALKRDIQLRLDGLKKAQAKAIAEAPKPPVVETDGPITDGEATEKLDRWFSGQADAATPDEWDAAMAWHTDRGANTLQAYLRGEVDRSGRPFYADDVFDVRATAGTPFHGVEPGAYAELQIGKVIDDLDTLIEKAGVVGEDIAVTVFRGANYRMFGPSAPKVGDIVHEAGYTTTTTEREVAEAYARANATVARGTDDQFVPGAFDEITMEIEVPKGEGGVWYRAFGDNYRYDYGGLTKQGDNYELLLRRDVDFRVIAVEVTPGPTSMAPKKIHVKVEMMPKKAVPKPKPEPIPEPVPQPHPVAPRPEPVPQTSLPKPEPEPLLVEPVFTEKPTLHDPGYVLDTTTPSGWDDFLTRAEGETVRVSFGRRTETGLVTRNKQGKLVMSTASGSFTIRTSALQHITGVEIKYGGRFKGWHEWRELPPYQAKPSSGPRAPRTAPDAPPPRESFDDAAPTGVLGDVPETPVPTSAAEAEVFATQFLGKEVHFGNAKDMEGLHQVIDGVAKVLRPFGIKLDFLFIEKPVGSKTLAHFIRGKSVRTSLAEDGSKIAAGARRRYVSGDMIRGQRTYSERRLTEKTVAEQRENFRDQKFSNISGLDRMLTDPDRWPLLEKIYGPDWRDIVQKKIELHEASTRWIVAHSVDDPIRALWAHEAAHALDAAYGNAGRQFFNDRLRLLVPDRHELSKIKMALSEYGATGPDGEMFAEAVAARVVGADMPPEVAEALDATLAHLHTLEQVPRFA